MAPKGRPPKAAAALRKAISKSTELAAGEAQALPVGVSRSDGFGSSSDEGLQLGDSDFDSEDLDASLNSVVGKDITAESGILAHKWALKQSNKRKRQRKQAKVKKTEDEDSEEGAPSPKKVRLEETRCMANPEVRKLLAQGQHEFANGDFDAAMESMKSVVREQPELPDPYHVLALIFKEKGDMKRVLESMVIAAYLTSSLREARPIWQEVGKLSLQQNLTNQALYAFKRSIPRNPQPNDFESLEELSKIYFSRGRHDEGLRVLFAWWEASGDYQIACDIARRLFLRRRLRESRAVLESAVERGKKEQPPRVDLNCMNMLCEVLIEMRDFSSCTDQLVECLALKSVMGSSVEALTQRLKEQSVDLVAKLAIVTARLRSPDQQAPEPLCQAALDVITQLPCADLQLDVVDGLLAETAGTSETISSRVQIRREACSWPAERALLILDNLMESGEVEEDLRDRRAMALWRLGRIDEVAQLLEAILEEPGSRHETDIRNIRVKLAETWIEKGDVEQASRVLGTLSYAELQQSVAPPPPISAADRRRHFQELSEFLEKAYVDTGVGALQIRETLDQQEVVDFASRFQLLIYDCELDFQRVKLLSANSKQELEQELAAVLDGQVHPPPQVQEAAEEAGQDALATVTAPALKQKAPRPGDHGAALFASSATSVKVKRSHLGVEHVEDMFGFEGFFDFVIRGVELIRTCTFLRDKKEAPTRDDFGRAARAVELCELILSNRRLVQQRNPARRRMMRALALKSVTLAFEGRLWRIVFKHLRVLCDNGPIDDDVIAMVTRILFTHAEVPNIGRIPGKNAGEFLAMSMDKPIPYAGSYQRNTYAAAFTDVRGWAIRKLCRNPRSFSLTFLCGHFCMVAGQNSLGVAEYSRAHRLAPNDAMTSLCLSVAYLSFAMSRVVVYRHDIVLKALTFLQRYRRLRLRQCTSGAQESAPGELWGGPSRELLPWEAQLPDDPADDLVMRAETSYNFARAFHQISLFHLAVRSYQTCLRLLETVAASVLQRTDVVTLRHSAAYNLAQIYTQQGSTDLASELLFQHVCF